MSTKNILILIIVGAIVLGGIYFWKGGSVDVPSDGPGVTDQTIKNYSASDSSFSFDYGAGYFLAEQEGGTPENPQKAIVIVEDTQSNRDLLEGKISSTTPTEGPTAIAIDVMPNPKGLTPEGWVAENTNWILADKVEEPITVGGKSGSLYYWDGLYAGKSAVVTSGTRAYVFSVTWITAEDKIISDFATMLASVKFAE